MLICLTISSLGKGAVHWLPAVCNSNTNTNNKYNRIAESLEYNKHIQ